MKTICYYENGKLRWEDKSETFIIPRKGERIISEDHNIYEALNVLYDFRTGIVAVDIKNLL